MPDNFIAISENSCPDLQGLTKKNNSIHIVTDTAFSKT